MIDYCIFNPTAKGANFFWPPKKTGPMKKLLISINEKKGGAESL